jgi:hypothetical protein
MTLPTEKYNTEHNKTHLKRHTEKFCCKTGTVTLVKHQVQQTHSLEQQFSNSSRFVDFGHCRHFRHFGN